MNKKELLGVIFRKHRIVLYIYLALFIAGVVLLFCPAPKKLTDSAGKVGVAVGTVVGEFQGIVENGAESYQAGKKDGLSATDTMVEQVIKRNQQIGRLEVLRVETEVEDLKTIGNEDYIKLSVIPADAVFYVDMTHAQVQYLDKTHMSIVLPKLEVALNFRHQERITVGEYQKNGFVGSAEAGYSANLNTDKMLESRMREELTNNREIMDQVCRSARRTVGYLARCVCPEGISVSVECIEEQEG